MCCNSLIDGMDRMASDADNENFSDCETARVSKADVAAAVAAKAVETSECTYYAPTERSLKSSANPGVSSRDADLREEFHNTATAAMNEGGDRRSLKIACNKCEQKLDVSSLRAFSHFECPVCGADLTVPQWFDNYLLLSAEGMGGMATVYKALDLTLDREVAIKILSPAVAQDKERCELFLNEARTAATINHYAVIPVYTCGVFEDQPYIVMQFMKNGSLEERIGARKPPAVKSIIKWMKNVTEGLECASKHGIVHHDIKPGNIMLDNAGIAKIGDFGIAQAINDSRASKIFEMTKSWVSPHYVSPEKAVSNKEDFRGDIYSLGASFYHLATGHTPFKHDDIEELIKQRLMRFPVLPNKLRRDIPRRLSALIMAMMRINPVERPDYKDILTELNHILSKYKKDSGSTAPAPGERRRKQLRKFLMALGFMSIWIVIAWALYRQYISDAALGVTEAHSPRRMNERVMRVSGCFRLGDSVHALQMSREIIEQKDASTKNLEVAALQVVIASYLNNSRFVEDNCAYVTRKLFESGVSPSAPVSVIIGFMNRKNILPEELRSRLKDTDSSTAFIGNYAIFLRELYAYVREESTLTKVLNEFQVLTESSKAVHSYDWTDCWKARLPLYKKILNKEEPGGEKLEPLMEKALSL